MQGPDGAVSGDNLLIVPLSRICLICVSALESDSSTNFLEEHSKYVQTHACVQI